MTAVPCRVTSARIGNSSGLRLPAALYRDHPQFASAAGHVEVLNDTTDWTATADSILEKLQRLCSQISWTVH